MGVKSSTLCAGIRCFTLSGLLLLASCLVMYVKGFNWGLDFTGGTVIELTVEKAPDLNAMRAALVKSGFDEPVVQNFGSSRDIMIRMAPISGNEGQELGNRIVAVVEQVIDGNASVKRIEFVGRAWAAIWHRPAAWRCWWR